MRDPDFPDELCSFIQQCTPSVEAVELLLFLARHPDKSWMPDELAQQMRPSAITESAMRDYLQLFTSCRLVDRGPDNLYRYGTPSPDSTRVVEALAKAYNERPVSLVRMIYYLKDNKIQSFAEAFKIRKR